MHHLTALLALAASAAAADVTIIWQYAKSSAQASLSVYDAETLIAQSCDNIIESSPQNIDFSSLDENGFGNFTIGDATYLAHSKAEYSGGPICIKKYNPGVSVVECSGISWTPSPDATIEEGCHDDEDDATTLQQLTSRKRGVSSEYSSIATKDRRGERICLSRESTFLVGDGNPHQNYFHKQTTETVSCGASNSCSAAG